MGVFTEQVQQLSSELRTERQERQEKRILKKKQEEAERNLYYKLENIFTCNSFTRKGTIRIFENKKNMYNFLIKYDIKNLLIEEITKNVDIQYYLDKKYLSILKKIYAPYKEQEKEKEKEIKQKKPEPEPKATTLDALLCLGKYILYILFLPILFFIMLFYYLLK